MSTRRDESDNGVSCGPQVYSQVARDVGSSQRLRLHSRGDRKKCEWFTLNQFFINISISFFDSASLLHLQKFRSSLVLFYKNDMFNVILVFSAVQQNHYYSSPLQMLVLYVNNWQTMKMGNRVFWCCWYNFIVIWYFRAVIWDLYENRVDLMSPWNLIIWILNKVGKQYRQYNDKHVLPSLWKGPGIT